VKTFGGGSPVIV